ncbi:MAG: hypothetical protein HY718_21640, partial [Planctomycetes bacterium]|nr:hypothetical protein [Planctomycetota bacterium]
IIETEKGLLISFNIVGSQVGGQPGTPSLTLNLGSIDPGATEVARWLMTSSLQGEFIEFSATFEHVNPLGIEGLSLVDDVSIHELTHVVRVDRPQDDGVPDFLVNDTLDLELLPDVIYGSDGLLLPVQALTEGTVVGSVNPPVFQLTLTVEAGGAGWTYVRVDDPAGQQYRLVAVRRPDGSTLPADNFWRTHRIIRLVGEPPREENRLHLLDHFAAAGPATYTLFYEPAAGFSPADLDRNGIVDGIDWGLFLVARGHSEGQPDYNPLADYDHDGTVTLLDQQVWLAAYREYVNNPLAAAPTPIMPPSAYVGDMDGDKDVDADDLKAFILCANGPAVPLSESCRPADADNDHDADQIDFALLQRCYSGAGVRPPHVCGRE